MRSSQVEGSGAVAMVCVACRRLMLSGTATSGTGAAETQGKLCHTMQDLAAA